MVPFTVQVCYFWPPGRYSAPMWAAQPGIGWVLPNQGSDRWPVGGSGHPEPLDSQGKRPLAFFSLFFFSLPLPCFFSTSHRLFPVECFWGKLFVRDSSKCS